MKTPVVLTVQILFALVYVTNAQNHYGICARPASVAKTCPQLDRSDTIICKEVFNGAECILDIHNNKTSFGTIAAEEALIGANFVDNVVVVAEFRPDAALGDESEYTTVVVVPSNYTGGFQGLRGKKLCHPGFKFNEVSKFLLTEFEEAVLKANKVDICSNPVSTLAEKQIKGVADFFGPSCRPGPWYEDTNLNKKLYTTYSKLCELCPSASDKCTVNSPNPFMESLECVVNGGGNLAFTSLTTVGNFLAQPENLNKHNDYKFLCRNGETADLSTPCNWSRQPWHVIIANKDKAVSLKNDLGNWLEHYLVAPGGAPFSAGFDDRYLDHFVRVFFPEGEDKYKINLLETPVDLKTYIKEHRVIPNERDSEKCSQDLKWCTVSDAEQQKCLWFAQAGLNRAIQPVIKCVQSPDKLGCLEEIKKDKADVVTVEANYAYIAKRKNLGALAFPETISGHLTTTLVVIKEENITHINKFENLKGKQGCFPEYGGIEWFSFINVARDQQVLAKDTCDYGKLISEFVGDSCMPGAHDQEHEMTKDTNREKLCSLCEPRPLSKTERTCNTDDDNLFYGNKGALSCLSRRGDFAVITKADYDVNESLYRVLCKNGTLAAYPGFNVDENCALATIVDGEVVSKRSNPKNPDISLALFEFEEWFGLAQNPEFELFNQFNHTKDLLFLDSTPGLESANSSDTYVKSYINLFSHIDQCAAAQEKSGALSNSPLPVLILAVFMLKCLAS